jgi:hypothetical protein
VIVRPHDHAPPAIADGRTYFDELAAALGAFGLSETRRLAAARFLRDLSYDAIWIPASGGYVALAYGERIHAWIHKSYIDLASRHGARTTVVRSPLPA